MPSAPLVGLLLSRDLIFTAKVSGTAEVLGCRVETVGSCQRVLQRLEVEPPRVLLLDLSAGDLVAPEAIRQYREAASGAVFIAFGSHVDTESLKRAEEAGCDQVMPRSRFVSVLPELLRGLMGGRAAGTGGESHEPAGSA
jgi:DNA-binding NarL/FixJ family response regulator